MGDSRDTSSRGPLSHSPRSQIRETGMSNGGSPGIDEVPGRYMHLSYSGENGCRSMWGARISQVARTKSQAPMPGKLGKSASDWTRSGLGLKFPVRSPKSQWSGPTLVVLRYVAKAACRCRRVPCVCLGVSHDPRAPSSLDTDGCIRDAEE